MCVHTLPTMTGPTDTTVDPLLDAAQALRDLVNVFTDREIDDELLEEIAACARSLSERASVAPRWDRDDMLEMSIAGRGDKGRGGFYYRAIAGSANPAATPWRLEFAEDEVRTEVTLGAMHGGAPGRGHGGVLAGILDEFAGSAPRLIGAMGATASLKVDYRSPIPIGEPLRLRAWIHDRQGRKIVVHGEARRDDDLVAEVEALFIQIDYTAIDTSGAARH